MSTVSAQFYYTGSGNFRNMCPIACIQGYFYSGGSCLPNTYVVQFQVPLTLPAASAFNVRKYIASIASLARISGCAYTPTTLIPARLYETACTIPEAVIKATVDTNSLVLTNSFTERRLLLTEGTANVVTEIRIASNATKAAEVQVVIAANNAVNSKLTTDTVGTTTASIGVNVLVESIVPASTVTPPKSTSPVSTSKQSTALRFSTTTSANNNKESTPQPTATPSPASSSNTVIIIGASAAVVVLIFIIAGVAVCMCSTRQKPVNNGFNTWQGFKDMARYVLKARRGLASNPGFLYVEVLQQLHVEYFPRI